MQSPVDVGILGATGAVGQQFINLLGRHPWFRVTRLAASERSEGKAYLDASPWRLASPMPEWLPRTKVEGVAPGTGPKLVFSALDAGVAGDLEKAYAEAGHIVVSNARNYRMDADVPLLVPEVNADHLQLLRAQSTTRGWRGAIVTNPNCVAVPLSMALAPLRQFGLRSCLVTSLQAVSGAGYPGVPSLDILGNVIPFISGEEPKVETETQKILGRYRPTGVEPHPMLVSAQTTRVPVFDGHTVSISLSLEQSPDLPAVRAAIDAFQGKPQELKLPSAPARPLAYLEGQNRPQPRLDVDAGGGMTVTVGRLRSCSVLGYKFFALGHNTIRGAAGAAILNAELMVAEGWLD